jgi:c-di-GMP-binding flagellar brake protein YcgR
MLEACPAPLPCEPIGSEVVVAPFVFDDPGVVDAALQSLVDSQAVLTVHAGDEASCVLGRLVSLDAAARRLVFACEQAVAPAAGTLLFVVVLHGVKLQFVCDWPGTSLPQSSLQLAMPASVIKLQRRRYSRQDAPLGLPFRAEFSILSHAYELGIDDLALGGVGLRAAPREAALLAVGRLLRRVKLLLGSGESCTVDLVVCSRRPWNSYLLGPQLHIGCRFATLPPVAQEVLSVALARLNGQRSTGR